MRFTEPLDKGLVTSRPPIMLREGELQRADSCYYQPNDPGLHSAPPAIPAATFVVGEPIAGLAHCAFDFLEAVCDITRSSTTVSVTPTVVASVATTNLSPIITAPTTNNFIGILKGATVTGTGIPASTTVLTWDSPTKITLSNNATATGTATLTFTNARFTNVSVGARVSGNGIANGTTVTAIGPTFTSVSISGSGATRTDTGVRLIVGADNLLVAHVGFGATNSTYRKAKTGADGTTLTFSTLETDVPGSVITPTLDQVHYNNLHVLLNGKHDNRVLMSDGLSRPHGLLPVTEGCTPTVVSGAWALKDGTGFYAYWTTEYDAVNDIESDFSLGVDNQDKPLKPPIVEITNIATQAVRVTRPARINPTATHWRIYRSIKYDSTTRKSADKENKYPNGWRIGQLELRDDDQQATFTDGGGLSSTAARNAGNASTGAGKFGAVWANPTFATGAPNNGGATDDTQSATLTYAGSIERGVEMILGNFTIPATTAPITGIQITMTGRRVAGGTLSIMPDTTRFRTFGGQAVPYTTSNSSVVMGGTSSLWGRTWDPADFADGKFILRCQGSVFSTGDKTTIDGVSIVVYFGETQDSVTGAFLSNITDPYPAVVVSPYGFTIAAGRGGTPPRATTGDIFQDSLLLNDVNDTSLARYSFPSRIDLFPAPYFLNFDTREQDEITFIRTVGNIAVVGLKHQLYRVNSLPRDTDSEFERGRAVEIIEPAHGIAGRAAGCAFTLPGFGQMLAYINNYGIFMTDGYRVRPLSSDLDWWATVDVNNLSFARLVNNTELHLLELYYLPTGGGAIQEKLFFHYHPSHLKGDPRSPELKVTGPVRSVPGVEVPEQTISVTTAGFPDGTRKVYRGTTAAVAGATIDYFSRLHQTTNDVFIKTRSIPAAQLGNEWRIAEIALGYTLRNYRETQAGSVFNVAVNVTKTDASDRTTASKSLSVPTFLSGGATDANPKSRRISKVIIPESGQAISIQIDPSSCGFRNSFDFITIDAEGQGLENPT